jgi:hypothetical protein
VNLFYSSYVGSLSGHSTIGRIVKIDIIFAMKIHVLVLDGVFGTGLATVLDAFATANEPAEMSGMA